MSRRILEPGVYSAFVLDDHQTWEQPSFRISVRASESDVVAALLKKHGGFHIACLHEDADAPEMCVHRLEVPETANRNTVDRTYNNTLVRVPDDEVNIVWKCATCGSVGEVGPDEATIPYCCDDDCKDRENEMEFSHVEVGGIIGRLVDAARDVVARWSSGDLAAAVRELELALADLKTEG